MDTAELYAVPARKANNGLTEKYMGTWFEKSKKRHDIILATKISGFRPDIDFIREGQLDYSPKQLNAALDGSLKRLKTDYVDIYQPHWPQRNANYFGKLGYVHDPADEWKDDFFNILETMDGFVKQGKIRHFAVSNETAWGLMHFINLAEKNNLPIPVSIQNPYNLLNRSFEIGLAECAIREKCGLLAYSPLGFGLLSGKYHEKTDTPDDRINQFKNLARYNSQQSWEATDKYLKLARKHNLSLAQMALAFVNRQPFTTSTIIGATSMAQLKENIESAEIILSEEILKEIDAIHNLIPNPAP